MGLLGKTNKGPVGKCIHGVLRTFGAVALLLLLVLDFQFVERQLMKCFNK